MTIDQSAIDALVAKLAPDGNAELTAEDRVILTGAILELAACQDIIARQTRLLQLHGELRSRLSAIAQDAIDGVQSRLDTSNPLTAYDFESAEAARRDLLAAVEYANTTRATLAATLAFVRRLIGLAA